MGALWKFQNSKMLLYPLPLASRSINFLVRSVCVMDLNVLAHPVSVQNSFYISVA